MGPVGEPKSKIPALFLLSFQTCLCMRFGAYTKRSPPSAVMSAGWFWKTNALNVLADQQAFKILTKRIHAGLMGCEDRLHIYEAALNTI